MKNDLNRERKFSFSDIQYGIDESLLKRAQGLLRANSIQNFQEHERIYNARVLGSKDNLYEVSINKDSYEKGFCNCYLGEHDYLCKHMITLALFVLFQEGEIDNQGNSLAEEKEDLSFKELISKGMQKITYYNGNSSTWFQYQDKLDTAARMISRGIEKTPTDISSLKYLLGIAKRINKKLLNGVDDSNGTIWPLIQGCIDKILDSAVLHSNDPLMIKIIKEGASWDSGFDFENSFKDFLAKQDKL